MSFPKRILSPRDWKNGRPKPRSFGQQNPGGNENRLKNTLIIIKNNIFSLLGLFFLFIKNMAKRIYSSYQSSSLRGRQRFIFKKIMAYGSVGILFAVIFLSIFSVAALAWFSRDFPARISSWSAKWPKAQRFTTERVKPSFTRFTARKRGLW